MANILILVGTVFLPGIPVCQHKPNPEGGFAAWPAQAPQ